MHRAVARLEAALGELGAAPIEPAGHAHVLPEIDAAVAPYRLPTDVRDFWTLVDGYSTSRTCFPYPHAATPDFALWDSQQEERFVPPQLFTVCYESHGWLGVELDGEGWEGGACFAWAVGSEGFDLVARDFTSYVDTVAQTIERGHVVPIEGGASVWWRLDESAFERALADRLREDPHPRWGNSARIDDAPQNWPEHWLASVGSVAADRAPRGATTTVAELLAAPAGGSGRIQARVERLMGVAGEGSYVVVSDASGSIEVVCPVAVTLFGPRVGIDFEFDVVTGTDLPNGAQGEARAVRPLR
jgi:hypothetical protein